ncbi:MAG: site-specific DNA-methyltransferase [Oscillospiraceae bacterium]|nr:site-specific DNA-methyltransferase [Oscillospiraceae bacterium]
METYFKTAYGEMILGDCLEYLKSVKSGSVSLIVTSPPYALIKKKRYGNQDSAEYLNWFRPFAAEFYRTLADNGSFVLNIGGSWNKGEPTRSLYHFKILIMLCEEFGFHLAQEFYFWNPSKLPNPAEWCTIRKIRVKDSIEPVWWLSKSPYPKASNQRVLQPYSKSMTNLLSNGYKAKLRPSGHNISGHFMTPHKGSIPPNLLALPNTESNSHYLRYCAEHGLSPHPARFPSALPEYFIRMCTDKEDVVMDPFAGSCVTGEVAERLRRKWICCDTVEEYLKGALGRFEENREVKMESVEVAYSVFRPGYLWDSMPDKALDANGGKNVKARKPKF